MNKISSDFAYLNCNFNLNRKILIAFEILSRLTYTVDILYPVHVAAGFKYEKQQSWFWN